MTVQPAAEQPVQTSEPTAEQSDQAPEAPPVTQAPCMCWWLSPFKWCRAPSGRSSRLHRRADQARDEFDGSGRSPVVDRRRAAYLPMDVELGRQRARGQPGTMDAGTCGGTANVKQSGLGHPRRFLDSLVA